MAALAPVVLAVSDPAFCQEARQAVDGAGISVAAFESSMKALQVFEQTQTVECLVTGLDCPEGKPNTLLFALMAQRRPLQVRLLFVGPKHAAAAIGDLGRLPVEPGAASDLIDAIREAN